MATTTTVNVATGEVVTRDLTEEEEAARAAANEVRDANISEIRNERDGKLARCDWTQANDSPLSTSKKTAWATYRQALRDFPDGKTKQSEFTKDSDGAIVWPTEPS